MNTNCVNSILARLIVVSLLISLASCSSHKDESNEKADSLHLSDTSRYVSGANVAQGPSPQSRLDSLCHVFELTFNTSRDSLLHKFGRPTKVDIDTVRNPYYGDVDSIFAYHFGKTAVDFYSATHDGKFFLKGVETEDFARFSLYGIFGGMKTDSLTSLFGSATTSSPDESDNTVSLTYETGEVESSYLTFTFRSDALIKIYYQAVGD